MYCPSESDSASESASALDSGCDLAMAMPEPLERHRAIRHNCNEKTKFVKKIMQKSIKEAEMRMRHVMQNARAFVQLFLVSYN